MTNSDIKILVVDDEADIRKVVSLLLKNKGYSVIEASNGSAAIDAVKQNDVDLIIMDIMMPKMSGIEATEKIRELSVAPVLFLTAKSFVADKERAYSSGGDDYVVKPFSSVELLMKVESLVRRYTVYKGKERTDGIITLSGGVEVDPEKRTVTKNGVDPNLRDKESAIFFYLLEHRGSTVEPDVIFEAVWGERALASSANNVTVNILGLRKKLEDDPSNPKIIKTVWGKGYQFV
ncbi:MAG: response regulator transcription factor [Clostridia bacterium]|nr:response regulator transcription factor [Clostridia bacterium]